MASLSESERIRRVNLLHRLIANEALDGLLLAANDYRGHKGSLRWVADYNLAHRYGYCFVAPEREPELILPQNLAMGENGSWSVPIRYPWNVADGLITALRELGHPERIGIVGLGQIMRVEEYQALGEAFPHTTFVDSTLPFERIRAIKSEEEIAGIKEAGDIVDRCLNRLLEVIEPGVTERSLAAEMQRVACSAGGEDFLFLSMYADGPPGHRAPRFATPRDRVLYPGDQHIFSFELIGPRGYWVELSRIAVLGRPTGTQRRLHTAVKNGLEAASNAMRPGGSPADVQQAIITAVRAQGADSAYWSGHGIGQDVIEEPWVGLETVQETDSQPAWKLQEGMAISLHPFVTDSDGDEIAYMSNVYIVDSEGAVPKSGIDLDLKTV